MTEVIARDGFLELCHDAKQSVATIMLLASAGTAEVDDRAQVLRRFDQIAKQTRWMASLLEDVLTDADDVGVVDLSAELDSSVKVATAGFPGTVRLSTESGVEAIGSATRLRRAFSNLLHNATRAAGDSGCVQVRALRCGGFAVVDIEDDGPGFGGLPTQHGLGLLSTRRAVESLGGSLCTGSSSLGGALVRVTLPAVPERAEEGRC